MEIWKSKNLLELSNRQIKSLLDSNKININEIKDTIYKRVSAYTRVDVANINLRVDLIPKQNEKDISLFVVLNNIYEYKELHKVSVYLPNKVLWKSSKY